MREQFPRAPRILRGNQLDFPQDSQRTKGNVLQITDRRTDEIQRSGRHNIQDVQLTAALSQFGNPSDQRHAALKFRRADSLPNALDEIAAES